MCTLALLSERTPNWQNTSPSVFMKFWNQAFPFIVEKAMVSVNFQKGDQHNPSRYGPISRISVSSIYIERNMRHAILLPSRDINHLPPHQHGLLIGRSCVTNAFSRHFIMLWFHTHSLRSLTNPISICCIFLQFMNFSHKGNCQLSTVDSLQVALLRSKLVATPLRSTILNRLLQMWVLGPKRTSLQHLREKFLRDDFTIKGTELAVVHRQWITRSNDALTGVLYDRK